jgi:hypothetical protein
MGIKVQRSTYKLGSSTVVTLPTDWCAFYAGRIAKVTILGDSLLIIAPAGLEEQAQKLIEEVDMDKRK